MFNRKEIKIFGKTLHRKKKSFMSSNMRSIKKNPFPLFPMFTLIKKNHPMHITGNVKIRIK
jgi:hypothetical protein